MRINHNLASLNTYRQLSSNNVNTGKSIEKLSSGLRINRAGDDAAGLAISEKMRAQIRGLDQASRNSQDAISMIQTTEGALNETQSILQRMRELATQAASDSNVAVDRNEIQKEINQLSSEINRIGNTTEFNTQKLLNGDKANTLTSFTGNFGSASGAAAAAVTGSIGISGVTFTGTGLSSGSHSVEITKTAEDHADQNVQGSNITTNTDSGLAMYFSGSASGAISYSGGTGNYLSGGFSIGYSKASGTITVSGTGASGSISDTVSVSASGKLTYNNFGLSFTVDVSALTDSGTITLQVSGTSGGDSGTFGTVQSGYGSNTGSNAWMSDITIGTPTAGVVSGAAALPDTEMVWTIKLSGASGANGFTISGESVNTGSGVVIQDAVAASLSGTPYTYNAYGLSFQISGNGGAAGDTVTFTTKPTYTWSATVDGAGSTTIQSGVSASSGVTATNFQIGGVEFDSTGLSTGSGTFNVVVNGSSGTDKSVSFQIGANQNQAMSLDINDMRANAIGVTSQDSGSQWVEISRAHQDLIDAGTMKSGGDVGGEAGKWYIQATFTATSDVTDGTNKTGVEFGLDMSTSDRASAAITVLQDAIERVSAERAKLGANQNRLEHTINNLSTSSENLTAAESRIRDVDMAKEMMEFTKNNILTQAAQAMLAQANQQPQGVLQLLR